ncbi:hypothetical protein AA0117_g11278 [Alternaria alternata]|uniref:Vacuolar ATPase assembly protein VMA22 n=1 Tax=Alternaria alternata TaxID=5599 RepID=A0A4Q4N3M8_ALTAL|nr:hypothetical protein AA0117_g11278 [Alternaria alternata]
MADVQELPMDRAEVAARRDKDGLLDLLDAKLEHYLHTLHEYQEAMQQLSKELSSGYMSLAQANFHNSSSAIRYGQDCYDERMQALRKVHIAEHGSAKSDQPYFSIYSPFATTQHSDPDNTSNSAEQENEAQGSDLPKPKEDDAKSTPDPNSQSSQNSEKTKEETNSTEKPTDPLRWFGILVPPALRTAQSTFVSAVEGPIPQLVTILRDLRTQEIEIGRIRKQIKKT